MHVMPESWGNHQYVQYFLVSGMLLSKSNTEERHQGRHGHMRRDIADRGAGIGGGGIKMIPSSGFVFRL